MKGTAGSGKKLRLTLAGVLAAGSLAGIGPGSGSVSAAGTQSAGVSVTENVYAGGVQAGLISWVDLAQSSSQMQGQTIGKLQDLAAPFEWTASGTVTYDSSVLNFNPAYKGYGYFYVPEASGFKSGITDTVEVFSVQTARPDNSNAGYPWEIGGTYSSAGARYIPSELHSYFGSDKSREVDISGHDLTGANILNMRSMPGEWAAEITGDTIELDTNNSVNFKSQVPSTNAYYFGAAHNQVLRGSISEMLVFNRKLTDDEREQVNSYLAIKYGITLTGDDLENVDYVASDGSPIWDADDNTGYGYRITGIGRDAQSGLNQKQSKSQNNGALVTLALGESVAASNKDNAGTMTNPQSFLTFGDNGKAAAYTGTVADPQTGSFPVMERTFKVERTDWVDQTVTLDLDLAQSASPFERYYLVTSADEHFAGAQFYPLDSDGRISLNSGELPDGSFFTFAHVDKTALAAQTSAIDGGLSGGTLKPGDYTADSWNLLQTKLNEAKTVLSNDPASQSAVDQALKELSEAYDALEPVGVKFERAVLEKGLSGSRLVVTLDRGVEFDGVPAGFTVRIGGQDIPAEQLNLTVDPQDPKRVLIGLPSGLDLSNIDTAGVSYDSASGSLQGLNGVPVSSFNEQAESGLGASLNIAQPDTVTGVVYGGEPAFAGSVDPEVDSLTVAIRDAQGNPVDGAGGQAVIDPSGSWAYTSEQPLLPGTYTIVVTATKGSLTAVKTRTFTVVDKTALQQRQDAVIGENLNGSAYTPSSWNELQQVLNEATQVLGDKSATQAMIDAALNRLNAARLGLAVVPTEPSNPTTPVTPVQPPSQPSVPAPPAPTKQIISVDVASGSVDLADITKVELERTTHADGSLSDLVNLTPTKAQEAIDKALVKKDPTARILIPDPNDAVSEVNVKIPQATAALLVKNGIDLEIHNPNGTVIVPASSLAGWNDDFYFRLVPIKQPQQRQQVETRAVTEQVVRELSGNEAAKVVSRPMTIETNLSSRPVTLVLPLDGTKLPTNAAESSPWTKRPQAAASWVCASGSRSSAISPSCIWAIRSTMTRISKGIPTERCVRIKA
ncbi:hypothetical protein [Saccharibacillus qingshengii]|uniref:hypothetical protein n=1 Tax=Saccharibacillus qingshengii TaxID=1763540 RepID=UPI001FE47BA5|nr:hypothetical protein [Saccharibacillus qingshengii]